MLAIKGSKHGGERAGTTALSILAEVLAVGHRRDRGRLRAVSGRIHDTRVNRLDRET